MLWKSLLVLLDNLRNQYLWTSYLQENLDTKIKRNLDREIRPTETGCRFRWKCYWNLRQWWNTGWPCSDRTYYYSLLLRYFLPADEQNFLTVEVLEKCKHEVGLVKPTKFIAFTKKKKNVFTLEKELKNRQEKLKYFDLSFTPSDTLTTVSFFE